MTRSIMLLLAFAAGCGDKVKPESPVSPSEAATTAPDSVPAAASQASGKGAVQDAVEMLEKNSPSMDAEAVRVLEKVILEQPDNAYSHFNLGVGYQRMGNYKAAERSFQNAVTKDASLSRAWVYLGAIESERGNPSGAIQRYRQGIEAAPRDAELRVALIGALRAAGKPDEAIAEGKSALAVLANSFDIYNNMGLAYVDKGELGLAQFMYQKAMTLPEGDKNAYLQCNLGWVYYLRGERYVAIARLKKAVELDPKLLPALLYLSRLYMEDHNYADSLPLLETAVKVAPESASVQQALGLALRGSGRFEEAKKAYEKALTLDPMSPDPHFNLGVLYGDFLKDYDKAVSEFKAYVSAGGKDAALATTYIDDVEKERKLAERRKKAEEDRKRKDAERKERERLLEEAAKAKPAPAPVPAPTNEPGAPAPTGEGQ